MKKRIHEFAKEMNMESKEIINLCEKLGINGKKHHMSTLNEEEQEKLRVHLKGDTNTTSQAKKEQTPVENSPKKYPENQVNNSELEDIKIKKESFIPLDEDTGEVYFEEEDSRQELKREKKFFKFKKRKKVREKKRHEEFIPKEEQKEKIAPIPSGPVKITPPVTVREFSMLTGIKASDIISYLMGQGVIVNINQYIGEEEILVLSDHFKREVEIVPQEDIEKILEEEIEKSRGELVERPPIVTILGHVDHGKTTLLDYIRKSNIQKREVGGITQHIRSYMVEVNGKKITFVDTPGHEAFTQLRARGANITDIVILIIAADDGIMPQTVESISHAKASGVPIIVAINKIDLPNANVEKVKQQLTAYDILIEEWGGDVICCPISAKTGEGVDKLLEMILLQAEMMELKGSKDSRAMGFVLESHVSMGKGNVARIIIKDGTLRKGDIVLCGTTYGRVKEIYNDEGKPIPEATLSMPVEITGLESLPIAGDKFVVMDSLDKAKEIANIRLERTKREEAVQRQHITLESLFNKLEEGKTKELKVIVKADVTGSLDAIENILNKTSTEEVKIRIIHKAVGGINESDVILADASDAIIIGFHVIATSKARRLAEEKNVQIRTYQIIYDIGNDIKKAIEGMLAPEEREKILGHVEVRQIFKISKVGIVAGCIVKDGVIRRNSNIRLTRENVVIYEGKLASLKRFKEDVKEVREGYECGLKIDGYEDIKVGDIIEAYEIEKIKKTLT